MAREYYRFFNSATGDERGYEADDLASALRTVAASGVAAPDGECLRVSAEGGTMRTLVGYGSAMLKGYHYELRDDGGAQTAFTHLAAVGGDRVDRIVIRLNLSTRVISVTKKEGAVAASPEPPALTRTDSVWELSLARVLVRGDAQEVAAADVIDERADESVCGAALPEGARLSALWGRMAKQEATASAAGLMSAADKAALAALTSALTPDLAARTLALNGLTLTGGEMRYGASGTVSAAIGANVDAIGALDDKLTNDELDRQIHTYTHARGANGVHTFTGTGTNGRVKIVAQVQQGDTFAVNGEEADVYIGGVACEELPVGRWLAFVYTPAVAAQGGQPAERAQVNFKSGGWVMPGYRLIRVSDAGELTAPPSLPFGYRSTLAVVMPASREIGSVRVVPYAQLFAPFTIYPEPWTATQRLYLATAADDEEVAEGTPFARRFFGRGGLARPLSAWHDWASGAQRSLQRVPAYTWTGSRWAAWSGGEGVVILP